MYGSFIHREHVEISAHFNYVASPVCGGVLKEQTWLCLTYS